MRLPVRVCPDPREGVWGWALRAAEANRYLNAAAVLSMVGYLAPIRPRAEVIANLAEAAGITRDYFEPLVAPRRGRGYVRLGVRGTDVPQGFLDVSSARVCQVCLKQAKLIPAEWDFVFWNACPCHGVKLLSQCPQCGHAVTWKRSHLDRCGNKNCSFVFSQGPSIKASNSELTLPVFVAKSMSHETLMIEPDLNEIFWNPTSSEALNIIRCVGAIAKSLSKEGRSTSRLKTLQDAEHALTDWPNEFRAIVERRASSPDLQESNQIFRVFDQIAGQGRISPAHAGILRDVIFLAAGRGPTRGPSSASAQKPATSPQKFVTQIAAARLLNVTHHTVRKLFHKKKVGGHLKIGKTGNEYLFIDIDDLSKEKSRRDNIATHRLKRELYLSVLEIYEIFGILPRFLDDFESCGLIIKSPQQEGGLYVRQSVEDLFRTLAEKCQYKIGSNVIEKDIITLKKVCRRFDVPLIKVIQSILCSGLTPKSHYSEKVGLDSIGIARGDILKFSNQYRVGLGGIQRRHAAATIGVQKREMKELIDRGFLEELQFNSSRPFKYISIESVRSFKRSYVPTVFISRILNTRGDALEKSFLELKLSPVIPRAHPDFTAYWSWTDLFAKLPEAQSWRRTFLDHNEFH